jgi:hypothetical protein
LHNFLCKGYPMRLAKLDCGFRVHARKSSRQWASSLSERNATNDPTPD